MSTYTTTHRLQTGRDLRAGTRVCSRQGSGPHCRRALSLRAFEWVAVLAVGVALIGTLVWLSGAEVTTDVQTRPVRVEAGDSLWSIAAAHPVAGLTTERTVDLIRSANGIDGSLLHPGQILHVPDAIAQGPTFARR